MKSEDKGDNPRSGRPATASPNENIHCSQHIVMDNKPLTINQIEHFISIYSESVENILPNELSMTKVIARCE